jgi:hypothetical protein
MAKTIVDIRSLARTYGPEAISILAGLMRSCPSPRVQAYAAVELLNRGYGRTHEDIEGREAITITIRKIFERDAQQQQPLVIDHEVNGNGHAR